MSTPISSTYEWHYVGHYGQLGPLSLDQMKELICDSVVERETFVWRAGMNDWVRAGQVNDLMGAFAQYQSMSPPPTPQSPPIAPQSAMNVGAAFDNLSSAFSSDSTKPTVGTMNQDYSAAPYQPYGSDAPPENSYYATRSPLSNYPTANYPMASLPRSDKSRIAAGILNIVVPGVGRMYLGYMGQGIMQLLLTPCLGLGAIWSMIDGVIILTGGVKLDGYNRVLPE